MEKDMGGKAGQIQDTPVAHDKKSRTLQRVQDFPDMILPFQTSFLQSATGLETFLSFFKGRAFPSSSTYFSISSSISFLVLHLGGEQLEHVRFLDGTQCHGGPV